MVRRLSVRVRKPPGFQKLRSRQVRWREKRAARRALFNRPTPIASYLLFIARLHRLLDLVYVALSLMVGASFVWQLAGVSAQAPTARILALLVDPWMHRLEQLVPPLHLGGGHWLQLAHVLVLMALALASQLLHRLIHFVAYRRPLIQNPIRS